MILDQLTQLSNAQAFTGAGDEKTTFSYDCGNPTVKNRIGTGRPMSLVFVITTAAAGGGSLTDTCDFCAVEDSQASLATSVVMQQRRVPAAELVVGKIVEVSIPVDKPTSRYVGGQVVLGTGDTVSADCFLIPSDHVQAFTAYGKNYTV